MPDGNLSVVLQMDENMQAALRADEAVAAMLDSYTVDSKAMADLANTDMRTSIARIEQIKVLKSGFVAPAKQIIANAEALFDPAINARQAFATGLRRKLEVFTAEQKRLADEARRKAEEEDRRRRQEAEAAAAAERARAEQQAAAERRQAEEAEQARKKAEVEGNKRAAAAAAAQAARLQEKAVATLANADVKVAETMMAAQAAAPVAAPEPEKVAGFSLRDNWKAELQPGKTPESVVPMIVAAITGVPIEKFVRPDLLPLCKLDMSAGDRLAKALKKAMNVPGVDAVNRQTSVSRAA